MQRRSRALGLEIAISGSYTQSEFRFTYEAARQQEDAERGQQEAAGRRRGAARGSRKPPRGSKKAVRSGRKMALSNSGKTARGSAVKLEFAILIPLSVDIGYWQERGKLTIQDPFLEWLAEVQGC